MVRGDPGYGLVLGEGRRCWVLGLGDGMGIGKGECGASVPIARIR